MVAVAALAAMLGGLAGWAGGGRWHWLTALVAALCAAVFVALIWAAMVDGMQAAGNGGGHRFGFLILVGSFLFELVGVAAMGALAAATVAVALLAHLVGAVLGRRIARHYRSADAQAD